MLTHLSLFSGIGGLDLAAEMAGFTTVGQCEWAEYPTKVLEKHWPDVARWRDIRTLTGESLFEKTGFRTVVVVSGGFPCQPFSFAGKRRGKKDDRYLWPEMLRVIREVCLLYIVGENVPGFVSLALDEVLSELEEAGYEAQSFIVPACGVDAPHRRDRVFFLARAFDGGGVVRKHMELAAASGVGACGEDDGGRSEASFKRQRRRDESEIAGMDDGLRESISSADAYACQFAVQGRCEQQILGRRVLSKQSQRIAGMHSPWYCWPNEPEIPRVVHGLPDRVDRIKCLGNAVVPQQAYPFFAAIREEAIKAVR